MFDLHLILQGSIFINVSYFAKIKLYENSIYYKF